MAKEKDVQAIMHETMDKASELGVGFAEQYKELVKAFYEQDIDDASTVKLYSATFELIAITFLANVPEPPELSDECMEEPEERLAAEIGTLRAMRVTEFRKGVRNLHKLANLIAKERK